MAVVKHSTSPFNAASHSARFTMTSRSSDCVRRFAALDLAWGVGVCGTNQSILRNGSGWDGDEARNDVMVGTVARRGNDAHLRCADAREKEQARQHETRGGPADRPNARHPSVRVCEASSAVPERSRKKSARNDETQNGGRLHQMVGQTITVSHVKGTSLRARRRARCEVRRRRRVTSASPLEVEEARYGRGSRARAVRVLEKKGNSISDLLSGFSGTQKWRSTSWTSCTWSGPPRERRRVPRGGGGSAAHAPLGAARG